MRVLRLDTPINSYSNPMCILSFIDTNVSDKYSCFRNQGTYKLQRHLQNHFRKIPYYGRSVLGVLSIETFYN